VQVDHLFVPKNVKPLVQAVHQEPVLAAKLDSLSTMEDVTQIFLVTPIAIFAQLVLKN
jgi:hypothetical protein